MGQRQSFRQNPARLRVRPSTTFLARRRTRFGFPDPTASMSSAILAARKSCDERLRRRLTGTGSRFST